MPRCIPSSSHVFPKAINTGSLRQAISSYIYFLRADHYYQKPFPLLKKTESMTKTIHTDLAPGKLCSRQNASYLTIQSSFLLSFTAGPLPPKLPQKPDLHDLTLHDLTQTALRNDFINSFQQMCKLTSRVVLFCFKKYQKLSTQRIQFRGVQTLTKEQYFVEVYLLNPNSVALKVSTQKK